MRKLKLLCLTALALFAFGAIAASSAFAVEPEEENKPRILCLVTKCQELEGTLKGGGSRLEDLNGKAIKGTGVELLLKNCSIKVGEPETDITLCVDVLIHFTGVKKEAIACRSENAKGEKDPVEIILSLLDLHMAAELHLNAGGIATVLLAVVTASVLGSALEPEVIFNCGGVKSKVKGVIACLFEPGLANIPITSEVTIVCKINENTHDPETGSCNVLCEDLGKIGLISTLDGKTEVDAWENIELKGKLTKDIYFDD